MVGTMMNPVSLGKFGQIDFEDWALGLWSAVISGGASAVVSGLGLMVIDPADFNLHSGKLWSIAGQLFFFNGFLGAMNFLRNQPAPLMKRVEHTVQTVESGTKAPVTTTIVKETQVVPIPADDIKGKQ